MKTESQIRSENSAAVNLLLKLVEEKQKKSDIAKWKEDNQKEDTTNDNIINILIYLEIQLLSNNINTITKMIESQIFEY